MRLLAILVLVFSVPTALSAQLKFERETRLKEEDVPDPALSFIQQANLDSKVKWYFEENLEGNSVEAKFKLDQVRYSVEFDTTGSIQDIEVEVKAATLAPTILATIKEQLAQQFSRYKIQKIQLQYSGPEEVLSTALVQHPDIGEAETRHEIVVKGRNSEDTALYEFTFDQDGQLLKQERIVFKNANHLEY